MSIRTILAIFLISVLSSIGQAQFNNPPGVPIWCGKAYQAGNASFEPGGWLTEPTRSPHSLLDLKVYPRFNVYVEGEELGSVVIDAVTSYYRGVPWFDCLDKVAGKPNASSTLVVNISRSDTGEQLVSQQEVRIGSLNIEFPISLSTFEPRYEPYNLSLTATRPNEDYFFTATGQVTYLPSRSDGGTTTKLDSIHGGLWVQDYLSKTTEWKPLLAASYYVSYSDFASTPSNLATFSARGYNIIHIVPPGGSEPYNSSSINAIFDACDALGLWVMYDMRHTYKNETALSAQVNALKNRKSLLLWYTADEPDGNSDPLNATRIAYDQLRQLDPYKPVSLVLNCQNFYYPEYSAGADIILQDAYPIGINATFSFWGTECNTTYGDCGCDNCLGRFEDVADRLDTLAKYQAWTGIKKALWSVPQAFGNETYWPRYPTPQEEVVLWALALHHGSKGITPWLYPTKEGIDDITSKLSKVLTRDDVTTLVLEGERLDGSYLPLEVSRNTGMDVRADIAAWYSKNGKTLLVSLVTMEDEPWEGELVLHLPSQPKAISEQVWGETGWTVGEEKTLKKSGLMPLEVDMLLLEL